MEHDNPLLRFFIQVTNANLNTVIISMLIEYLIIKHFQGVGVPFFLHSIIITFLHPTKPLMGDVGVKSESKIKRWPF